MNEPVCSAVNGDLSSDSCYINSFTNPPVTNPTAFNEALLNASTPRIIDVWYRYAACRHVPDDPRLAPQYSISWCDEYSRDTNVKQQSTKRVHLKSRETRRSKFNPPLVIRIFNTRKTKAQPIWLLAKFKLLQLFSILLPSIFLWLFIICHIYMFLIMITNFSIIHIR